MKTALVLAVLALLPASSALANDYEGNSLIRLGCCEPPVHLSSRIDARGARLAINTQDGDATLLITDRVIAVQLSDQMLNRIKHKLRDERYEDEDNALAQSIKAVVFAGVRSLLNHSASCRIRDVRDVSYADGHLVILSYDRDEVFADLDVNDDNVMEGFTDHDARAFVDEFRRVKSHWH